MADETNEREARDTHEATLTLLRDLRTDANFRIGSIIDDQFGRSILTMDEERRQREWVRGELVYLQRRIDETLSRLH